MADVVIFGAGDFAQVAAVYLDNDSPHEVVAFTVHADYVAEREILGRPVVPFEELPDIHPPGRVQMLVATGFKQVNRQRTALYEECKEKGYGFISYVCSGARTYAGVEVGENTFIFEDNVIQPFVRIGSNVVCWSGNHIGHHAVIEDHCFIASHAVISGRVRIGHSSFVGVNATFRDNVTVAPQCVIGAGALIMKDTVEGGVYSVRGTEPLAVKSWDLKNF